MAAEANTAVQQVSTGSGGAVQGWDVLVMTLPILVFHGQRAKR